ncbi:MAG: lamin tail domain-containing protein [Patescibacteria group bacterium]
MSNKKIIYCINLIVIFILILFYSPSTVRAQVTINEFLPDSSTEWIELYNSSASAEFLKNYYIDDDTDFNSDSGSSGKKLLSALNISNVNFPFIEVSSFLNNTGDWVALFDSMGNLVDSFQYQSNPGSNISMGRSPDGNGSFFILSSLTKGATNSLPIQTPTPTLESTVQPISSSTSSPTNSPTLKPTSTPAATKAPTLKPTNTPNPKSTGKIFNEEVLGIQNENESPNLTEESEENSEKSKVSILSILFIVLGISFVGFSGFAFFKQKRLNNNEGEKNKEII